MKNINLILGHHMVSNKIQGKAWFVDRGQSVVDMDGGMDTGRLINLKPVFSGIWCESGDGKSWVASTLEEAYEVYAKKEALMERKKENSLKRELEEIISKYGDIFTDDELAIISKDTKLASNLMLGRKPVRITSNMEVILQKCGII